MQKNAESQTNVVANAEDAEPKAQVVANAKDVDPRQRICGGKGKARKRTTPSKPSKSQWAVPHTTLPNAQDSVRT